MEKIIIMGGSGFIGKNIVENLINDYELIVIDKFIDDSFIYFDRIKVYQYDFLEDIHINEIILIEKPEYIINLISIVSAERNMEVFDEMIQVNLKVLLKLYDAVKNLSSLKFFLHFGSGEEYGDILNPYKESDRECPNSPYSLVKQITTNTAVMLYKNYHFPIGIVRPGNLFGKYQNDTKFIPYIIKCLVNNKDVDITLGEQKRDFIYIKDFIRGITLILKNYKKFVGEVVNLSSGKSDSLRNIILFCKDYIKSESIINFGSIQYRENEMMNFELDINKFKYFANDEFNIDTKKGLIEFIGEIGGI